MSNTVLVHHKFTPTQIARSVFSDDKFNLNLGVSDIERVVRVAFKNLAIHCHLLEKNNAEVLIDFDNGFELAVQLRVAA